MRRFITMSAADLILRSGVLFEPDIGGGPAATALAVRGGRIAAIGADDEVGELRGPDTEVIDLRGRLLLPGFQDAHVHPVFAGLTLLRCDLNAARDPAGYLRLIDDYARAHPDEAWVTGGGWSYDAFGGAFPHRELLDRVLPDRPAHLMVRDAHSAWCNSAALSRAGITRHTLDPPGGRIERDAAGEPTGVLHESAMELVGALLPPPTPADLRQALLLAQRELHAVGVTAWQDAIVGDYGGWPDALATYLAADAAGELTATVRGALWWDPARDLDQLPDLLDRRDRARSAGRRFRAETVKIMQDGVAENRTAAMIEPYLDACGCATAERGLSRVDPRRLRAAVSALADAGFQLHFHAIGDRAGREVLEALGGLPDPAAGRHHVAHVQVVHPADVPRFASLGVAVTMQALWATHEPAMDEMNIPFLGATRAGWQYPFGAFHAAGTRLAAGSDWPVSDPDPMRAIHVAVNRTPYGVDLPALLPDQALSLSTALRAYTAGSAYVNRLDDRGVLRVGNPADLVLLDRDPFAGPPAAIGAATAAMTWIDGAQVYAAPDAR
jgi:predicted amidohydrolase YtcJ